MNTGAGTLHHSILSFIPSRPRTQTPPRSSGRVGFVEGRGVWTICELHGEDGQVDRE